MSDIPLPLMTRAHLDRAARPSDGPLYSPDFTLLDDTDLDRLAGELLDGRPRPVRVFAYGSLIWNPGFSVATRRRGTAIGWHRQFSIHLDHFRGSPDTPGLMLALARGGTCQGLILDIEPGTECQAMRALLRRELVAHELAANAVWITVETDQGIENALTFYADPVGVDLADLTIPEQARRLARANGAAGSGAEYLHNTVHGLHQAGIFDAYIWELDRLVAAELD
ncbi:gamma-glutamylcyclotransferase [Paracoccus sp. (in: a-proteobacteria)]|uniref:gamma-glutamylcyclotransferase n=1 Tax=Paracoccus sp. TaxID=267 RepID=UPI0026DF5CD3|nr:gamma-glutamylcyclotransferase [Paracoccus sp. (in: a-proteobacteria)]MDO5647288.1 gamma-glutamylcyclotransferase [Paracoccus sp. (in: a-proteobacteria)]